MAGREANDWTTDTYAQRLYINYLLNGLGGMDATSVHAYGESTDDLHISENKLKTTASRMSLSVMVDEARALSQPLYVGEAGTGTTNGNTDTVNIQKTLDGYVKLGLQLVHWWSYDTCRQDSFNDDSNWNMNMTDFPESVALLKAANEALKTKWLVNRADEDVVVTDMGDTADTLPADTDTQAPTDTTAEQTGSSDTTSEEAGTDTGNPSGGCRSAIAPALLFPVTALAAWILGRKKRED
jgi:hypothetical protein